MWRCLVHAWDATQVELHGRYSVQRLQALDAYTQRSSYTRSFAVGMLTPLPCLVVVALADSIPLEPVERGLAHSQGLWVRYFFAVWVYSVCALEQLKQFIPAHLLRTRLVCVMSVAVSILANAVTFGLTVAIGFPLPFTIQVVCIPSGFLLACCVWITLRDYFRANPLMRRKLVQFLLVIGCELSLAMVYPAFNAVFVTLSGSAQTAFTLLLPIIKLVEKNMMRFALRHLDDLAPEIIVFNVEIFNALFVACCMQNAKSIGTNVVLVAVDFVQGCIGLRDLDGMLGEIAGQCEKMSLQPGELMDAALQIARENPDYEQVIYSSIRSNRRLRSQRQSKRLSSAKSQPKVTSLFQQATAVAPLDSAPVTCTALGSVRPKPALGGQAIIPVSTADAVLAASSTHGIVPIGQVVPIQPPAIHLLTAKEQQLFLRKTLEVLHLIEFLLLVEFTEVVIPIIYSLYLSVLFGLPNRAYYPQLRNMDTHQLRGTIATVTMNATLELLSLVALGLVLKKRLRIATPKLLAFVLETQWRDIQSKMVLWIVVSLQCSLVHLGADYTFRFEWLRGE